MDKEIIKSMFGEDAVPKDPKPIDRSTLQKWAECPHQAGLIKQHKIEAGNELIEIGNIIHKLVEDAYKSVMETDGWPDLNAMAEYIAEELPKSRPDVQPEVIRQAKWLCDQLLNLRGTVVDFEHQIEYLHPTVKIDGHPAMLTTCLDVILAGNKSLIICDWKTGFKRRNNQDAFDDFQTQFAAYILWQQYKKQDVQTIHFWYNETLWGSKAYARLDRDLEDARLPHLTQEMAFKARIDSALQLMAMQCEDAWPDPKKCMWCDCILKCKYSTEIVKDISENPKGFLDNQVVLKALVKKRDDAMVEYLKSGKVLSGSKTIFEWRQPSQKFTPKIYKQEKKDGNTKAKDNSGGGGGEKADKYDKKTTKKGTKGTN